MLGASWRRAEDPALSRDPRVRAVVAALATLPAPEPHAVFRAELRAQLVAIAPRIIAESAPTATPTLTDTPVAEPIAAAGRPKHADGVFARLRGISFGRPLAIAASVITVFAMLLGGAVWMSQKALPGDTLYGLKRASENVRLDLAGSDTAKAKLLLQFAGTRVDEANGLASRATADAMGSGLQAGVIDSHTADLIDSTLGSADSDVKNATTLLTNQAVASNSSTPLKIITDWAPSQLARLKSLAAAVPDGSLRQRAQSSAWLVNAAANRAKALVPVVANGCASTADTDSLGALPSSCTSSPTQRTPGTGKQHTKGHHPNKSGVGTNTAPGVSPLPGTSSAPAPGTSGSSSSPTSPIKLPPVTLPPVTAPSVPVTINNSCVKVIVLSIGSCGP